VEHTWAKTAPLNQLNCHLHPLESIATACCKALAQMQEEKGCPKGECYAAILAYKVRWFANYDAFCDHGLFTG
jgi:hypothetical protein